MTQQPRQEYIIDDDDLAIWRSGCINWRSREDTKCYGCEFTGVESRKGCCEFDDDEMQKIFQSRPAPSPELIDSTKGMEQKSETKSPDGRYHLCRSDASRHTCINVDEIRKEAAAQAREDALKPISAIYERFKHLDDILSKRDPDCPMMLCYVDIWEAVKESLRHARGDE